MKANKKFSLAIACALLGVSLSVSADTLRLNYTLNTKMPAINGGGAVTPPVTQPEPEPDPTPEVQYDEQPITLALSTGSQTQAVVSGNQGTYTRTLPNRILITSLTFEDFGGSGYESTPKIISQGCAPSGSNYVCSITIEAGDDSGSFGGASPWEAAVYGVDGKITATGIRYVPKPDA